MYQLHFYMLFLFWPISTLGFDLSDFSFTLGKRGHRAFRIAEFGTEIIINIDLKIRLLQKRETKGCMDMFSIWKIGSILLSIPVHNKDVYRQIIRMDTFILDHQSRPYFYFNKAFNQDALKYKAQNPAVLFTKESIENAEFWSRKISRFFFY